MLSSSLTETDDDDAGDPDAKLVRLRFSRDADEFYEPRSVSQLADGRLLVFDGGASRPGCRGGGGTSPARAGCYSRAALYRLDFMTKKAELEWQYELETQLRDGPHDAAEGARVMTHDEFDTDGGSVQRLGSGLFLVGFTTPDAGAGAGERTFNANRSITAFEVDMYAEVHAKVVIPRSRDEQARENVLLARA